MRLHINSSAQFRCCRLHNQKMFCPVLVPVMSHGSYVNLFPKSLFQFDVLPSIRKFSITNRTLKFSVLIFGLVRSLGIMSLGIKASLRSSYLALLIYLQCSEKLTVKVLSKLPNAKRWCCKLNQSPFHIRPSHVNLCNVPSGELQQERDCFISKTISQASSVEIFDLFIKIL